MGSHAKSTSVLLEAGRTHLKLFMDYTIKFATPSLGFTPSRLQSQILHQRHHQFAWCRIQQCANSIKRELSCKDKKFHLQLQKRIRDGIPRPEFKLRTHAEINILDLFHQNRLRFLDMGSDISESANRRASAAIDISLRTL